ERGRDERCRRNRQPYADRGREKQDRTSVTDRRYDRLVTEPRQEIDVGEIADEDRHQPDRAGARHHQYVAQQRARDEYRPLGGPDYGLDICHYSLSTRACRARAYYAFKFCAAPSMQPPTYRRQDNPIHRRSARIAPAVIP